VKGLAELKNKVVNAPHVNMFKVATWATMGVFATYLLIYIFAGEEMLKYYPLLIVFAFGAPFVSLMTSKASVKRAYNIRMIDNGGARTEKEQLVVDTVTLLSEKLNLQKLPDVNGDMLTSSILEGFVSAFGLIISYIILNSRRNNRSGGAAASMASFYMIKNGINFLGRIVASWYSRRREFGADRLAAQITDPSYMKSALLRLQEISEGRVNLQPNDREFAAFKITNNFSMGNMVNLFSTHPSLEKRIAAIERMEK